MKRIAVLTALAAALASSTATAQTFETLGTRAAGMGGAFVAVTDDASAIYWNPGALASGAFFSLLIDRNTAESTFDDPSLGAGGSTTANFIGLGTPPVGVAYYRLRSTRVVTNVLQGAGTGVIAPGASEVETLITHHAGVTLVHSILPGLSVGGAVKLVRGIASTALVPSTNVDELLDEGDNLVGEASNKFDADLGVAAVYGTLRAGLTVRNVMDNSFEAPGGAELELERQARAGVSLSSPYGFVVAVDVDITKVRGSLGDVRDVALGTEARIFPRAYARAGFRFNTVDSDRFGHAPVGSFGGSFAALSSLWVDGQVTVGSEAGGRGWGVAARVAF